MTPERWQQIETLYHDALGRPPAERAAWLAAACGTDDALRDEVEELLRYEDDTRGFLNENALQVAARGLGQSAASMSDLTGKQLGSYRVLAPLGKGGMGEVSLVRDNDIGRIVALKRLYAPPSGDQSGLVRFISEVRTVGQLEHPNIVPIHDVGLDENGNYYFVMKYVDGETLEHIIKKLADGDPYYHQRYPVDVRLEIFMGLLRALQYAHDQGIVHRDIKPWNFPLLDLPKFLRGEFRGNTAQLIPRFSRRVNKKIPDGTFGIGLQVRQIHWDFLAYRRYCALL